MSCVKGAVHGYHRVRIEDHCAVHTISWVLVKKHYGVCPCMDIAFKKTLELSIVNIALFIVYDPILHHRSQPLACSI